MLKQLMTKAPVITKAQKEWAEEIWRDLGRLPEQVAKPGTLVWFLRGDSYPAGYGVVMGMSFDWEFEENGWTYEIQPLRMVGEEEAPVLLLGAERFTVMAVESEWMVRAAA
ncbi:hypothetical protein AB3R30_18780 [Leptolyngbyaceae cyanobacterium UHCC 1019]